MTPLFGLSKMRASQKLSQRFIKFGACCTGREHRTCNAFDDVNTVLAPVRSDTRKSRKSAGVYRMNVQ